MIKARSMQLRAEKRTMSFVGLGLSASLLLNGILVIGSACARQETPSANDRQTAQQTSAAPETSAAQESSAALATGPTSPKPAQQSSTLRVVSTTVNFKRLGKRIEFQCPHFVGGDPKTCAKLNRLVGKAMNEDAAWDLVSMEFDKTFVDKDSVSTAIQFYRQGGAHRNGFYEPLNFHLTPAVRPMTVKEFFGKKPDIDKLSVISAKYIAGKFKDTQETQQQFYDCLKGDDHAFDKFIFDQKGVTFTFCQLTCEAFGVQSFKIPLFGVTKVLRQFILTSISLSQALIAQLKVSLIRFENAKSDLFKSFLPKSTMMSGSGINWHSYII